MKGQSGNPEGRPKGSRNKATLAAEMLLDGELNALTAKVVELAREGDMTAMRICLDRAFPVSRKRFVQINLPEIKSATEAYEAIATIIQSVAKGDLALEDGASLVGLVERLRASIKPADEEAIDDAFQSPFGETSLRAKRAHVG